MGAGQSTQTFFTRTDSLDVWLHQENFRYSLHAIQRDYEWKRRQVVGLLETVAKVKDAQDDNAIVKLSEVILLDRSKQKVMAPAKNRLGGAAAAAAGGRAPSEAGQGNAVRGVVDAHLADGRIGRELLEGEDAVAAVAYVQDATTQTADDRWHLNGRRDVEIIDGQQRITTLVLIAAVSQYKLLELVHGMKDEEPVKETVWETVEGLRDRFSLDEGGGILLSRRGGAGGDGLVDGMFNFAADKNDASELDIELRDLLTTSTASNHRGEPLKTNTIHIYKWLNDRLKQVAPACAAKRKAADAATAAADAAARAAALAASADDAATAAANAAASAAAAAAATAQAAADIAASMRAAKQATWLLGLLETFRCRVQWTTSLTASRSLALHTFLNVNLDSHRVPLKEIDVIKVALVSDISKERYLDSALGHWRKCTKVLEDCAETVVKLAQAKPYLQFLGSGGAFPVDKVDAGEAMVRDCLCHVRAIEEASGDGFASIDLDNKDTQADLAQYFAEQHATRRADEDPRAYITNTLLPYLRAYRTLLTMELPADSGGQQLPLEARASLSTLLSLPIDCQTKKPQNQASDQTSNPEAGTQYSRAAKFSTWRPAAVAIIRELSRDGMLARSGAQELLTNALKQLECVVLWLATLPKSPPIQTRTAPFMAIIQEVTQPGIKTLKSVLSGVNLRSLAFRTMAELPAGSRRTDGEIRLIKDLYINNAYSLKGGRVAKALLLGLEMAGAGNQTDGFVMNWEGKMQLEHLLPQSDKQLPVDWQEQFGRPQGPIHRTFAHMLGNLSIITGADNVDHSNLPFEEKLLKMEESQMRRYRTLKMVFDLKGSTDGWSMRAVLARHKLLLELIAKRYVINVEPEQWEQWNGSLLRDLQKHEHMPNEDKVKLRDKLGNELAQAAAAAAAGAAAARAPRRTAAARSAAASSACAVLLTAGNLEAGLPDSIRSILASVSGTALLTETSEAAVIQLLHQAHELQLTSPPPHNPEVGSLYMIDEAKAPNFRTMDGHSWIKRGGGARTVIGPAQEVLQKMQNRTDHGMKRYIWELQAPQGAAGEGQADASSQPQSSYRLVQYVQPKPRKLQQTGTPARRRVEGAAGGGSEASPPTPAKQAGPAAAAGAAAQGTESTTATPATKRPAGEGAEAGQAAKKPRAQDAPGPSAAAAPAPQPAFAMPGAAGAGSGAAASAPQLAALPAAVAAAAANASTPAAAQAVAGGQGPTGEAGAAAAGSAQAAAPAPVPAATAVAAESAAASGVAMQLIPVHPSQVPSNIKDILDNYISGHPMSATDARKLLDHAHQIQFTSLLPYQEPAGSLFLIDEAKVPNFTEHDGYNWGPKHKKWPKDLRDDVTRESNIQVDATQYASKCLKRYIWRLEPNGAAGKTHLLVQYELVTVTRRPQPTGTPAKRHVNGAAGGSAGMAQ